MIGVVLMSYMMFNAMKLKLYCYYPCPSMLAAQADWRSEKVGSLAPKLNPSSSCRRLTYGFVSVGEEGKGRGRDGSEDQMVRRYFHATSLIGQQLN